MTSGSGKEGFVGQGSAAIVNPTGFAAVQGFGYVGSNPDNARQVREAYRARKWTPDDLQKLAHRLVSPKYIYGTFKVLKPPNMDHDDFLGELAGLALSDLARLAQRQRIKNMVYDGLIAAVTAAVIGGAAGWLTVEAAREQLQAPAFQEPEVGTPSKE